MLDKAQHQLVMGKVLKDIYSNNVIAPYIGFKGGTCAYFFYNLPRFSVDLDFDLLSEEVTKEEVMDVLVGIAGKYGVIKEKALKRFTIFLILSYGPGGHNIKIEVNTRLASSGVEKYYEPMDYLGIDVLAAKKEYLLAGKLAALAGRSSVVPRDIFDIRYFLDRGFAIDREALLLLTGEKEAPYLKKCIKKVESYNNTHILQGLGELISDKGKDNLKRGLKEETLFLLKNYLKTISSAK